MGEDGPEDEIPFKVLWEGESERVTFLMVLQTECGATGKTRGFTAL
jgi:hypothetical protein